MTKCSLLHVTAVSVKHSSVAPSQQWPQAHRALLTLVNLCLDGVPHHPTHVLLTWHVGRAGSPFAKIANDAAKGAALHLGEGVGATGRELLVEAHTLIKGCRVRVWSGCPAGSEAGADKREADIKGSRVSKTDY